MATSNVNNASLVSQMMMQANDTLHGSYIEASRSPQVINNVSSPAQQQFIMPAPIQHSSPMHPQVHPSAVPQVIHQVPPGIPIQPPPITRPTDNMDNITPQMMFSNMNDTHESVKRLENIMSERLAKLDILDELSRKLDRFEVSMNQIRIEIDDIRETQDKHSKLNEKQEAHHHDIETRVRELEQSNRMLQAQNAELKENFLELQTRSMKYNLIFGGIPVLMVI